MFFRLIVYFFLSLFAVLGLRFLFGNPRRPGRPERSGGGAGAAPGGGSIAHRALVQDPQCGLRLDPEIAKTARIKGVTCYFCSDECLQAYQREHQA